MSVRVSLKELLDKPAEKLTDTEKMALVLLSRELKKMANPGSIYLHLPSR